MASSGLWLLKNKMKRLGSTDQPRWRRGRITYLPTSHVQVDFRDQPGVLRHKSQVERQKGSIMEG
jgi:hypothetical protein